MMRGISKGDTRLGSSIGESGESAEGVKIRAYAFEEFNAHRFEVAGGRERIR